MNITKQNNITKLNDLIEKCIYKSFYSTGKYLYTYECIAIIQRNIDKIEELTKDSIIDNNINTLLTAIDNMAHPYFVAYLWTLYGKKERYSYDSNEKYDKMPHIYNKKTGEIIIRSAIKDLLEWLYIACAHQCITGVRNDINIIILDEYAKIFEIDYDKHSYDLDMK